MKISNSYIALKDRAVSILHINVIKELCKKNDQSIWDFLKNQVIYVVSKIEDKYEVTRFLVAHYYEDNYVLWKEDGEFDFDENDRIYDNLDEARSQRDHLNNPTRFFPLKKGESRKIWNIILQTWDKYGKEKYYTIDSFTTEESAVAKYYEWMDWDRKAEFKIEEEEGEYDYTYTKPDGDMTRCHIVESELWNQ